ncbi:MAG: Do family serine endopeptidase [Candidatus Omnitrophica bacterium]|nr:Do family serine endopeptidase [Candidatus Omnitrophota bacterium]
MKKYNKRILLVLCGLVLGVFITLKADLFQAGCAQRTGSDPQAASYNLESQTIKVAQDVGQAVVSISTEVRQKTGGYRQAPFDDFGDDFFRRFFEEFFGDSPYREFKRQGLGSGVIIDKEGYILTNEHVVSGADTIKVRLADAREFDAEVKGADSRSDLAVIKIKASNLPAAVLGDSAEVKIGQWVVAIGNPFGFAIEGSQPTVTVGVISALHRDLPILGRRDKSYNDLIQTDAAINPGNSGGPLVDMAGRVIGINAAIISTTGGYQGLGFAIPVNKAKKILQKLIKGEEILYGWLGVSIQDLNEDLKNYFGLSQEEGALIIDVFKDSPASKAGLMEGDLILELEGQRVTKVKDLVDKVTNRDPETKITLKILRQNKLMDIEVTLGKRPGDLEGFETKTKEVGFRGLEVDDITDEIKRRYRISDDEGAVVTYVEPDSPADKAGIIASDIIQSVEGNPIKNKKDFLDAISGLQGDCLVKTNRGFSVIKDKSVE